MKKERIKFLWVTFFIICIPFQFVKAIGSINSEILTGPLGSNFYINIPILLSFIIWIQNFGRAKQKIRYENWMTWVITLIIVSIFNPYNSSIRGSLALAFFLFSHFLLFYFFYKYFTKREIIKGIFYGFLFLSILQFVLAICFPVLDIKFVTTLFNDSAEAWSSRNNTREGAVGVFVHPGHLALFSLITSSFFLSTYFSNYKKLDSLVLFVLCTITIILTYSRTSYVAFIIVTFAQIFIFKNAHKAIFSIASVMKFGLPAMIFLGWLIYFSPLSQHFIESDSNIQVDNRLIHWYIAIESFKVSPIIGVGLNAHLAYLINNLSIVNPVTMNDFFLLNPIHNIHLMILAESGIGGFVLWCIFLMKVLINAKNQILIYKNPILPLTSVGIIVVYIIYGMTGWAPFSQGILPFFLSVIFFTNVYSKKYK